MKRKIFAVLLGVCIAFSALIGLTACNGEVPVTPEKLSTPVVTLTENVASWDADPDADKFEISLDGYLSYVENTVTIKSLSYGQTFKIRAVGNGITHITSEWSNSVTYTGNAPFPIPALLGTPTVTISSSGIASWEAVENASGYVYKINGGAETATSTTSVQLTDGQSITVKAVGDGVSYTDGHYSITKTYTEGAPSTTKAPEYLGITASVNRPTESDTPEGLARSFANEARASTFEQMLRDYLEDGSNSLGEDMPEATNYVAYSAAGSTVYIQIWLDNPDQNTVLSLKLNGTKYQSGGALQSFFIRDDDTYLNCVYVAVTIPSGSYSEISYEVTEIEYVEGTNINQDGKAVLIDGDNDTVKIGLTYESYPTISCGNVTVGSNSIGIDVTAVDASNLIGSKGYWLRAVLLDEDGVVAQSALTAGTSNEVRFTKLAEEKDHTLAIFYLGDKNDGLGVTYEVLYTASFTTSPVVNIDDLLFGGELDTENGRNGAKINVFAYTSYDAEAEFDRVEIYDEKTLVLTDTEFEGYEEYSGLNTKTEYTVKIYYSSTENGYTGHVKEVKITTPRYDLPDVDGYGSDNNVVVGNHAIYSFKVERYTDVKYYDISVRGFIQNDEYYAPFIVEMLEDPDLLGRLEQEAFESHGRPGYVWEAGYYAELYSTYYFAWEHKERCGYSDDEWREIAELGTQYIYNVTAESGDLFIANDGDVVYNYYAVLRDYFNNEPDELRFEIMLHIDLGDGMGVRDIVVYSASPYFHDVPDDNYGFDIVEDESVKNGYIFTETDMDYKALYVYKLALYRYNEFICYVPFTSNDITSIDTDGWLEEWIEKLRCEIPDATEEEMLAVLGPEIIKRIFDELWFEEDGRYDEVVDSESGAVVGGNSKGNERERKLLALIGKFDADALTALFEAITGESKTLDEFIEDSENSVIIDVITAYRSVTEVTAENAFDLYTAIDGVYDVKGQLKSAYESHAREEIASKVIVDRIEAITSTSFVFVVGVDLAPAGEYQLRVLYRSLIENYEDDEFKGEGYHYVNIRRDLDAPENIRLSEDKRQLVWDAVEGASEYIIYVNGEEKFTTWETYTDKIGEMASGDVIRIMATGYNAYDSEPSDEFTYVKPKLTKPSATVSGHLIEWEYVENASGYVYTVNGGDEQKTSGTSIYVAEGGAVVRIKAVNQYGIYSDSDWTTVTVSSSSADKEK